MSYYAITVTWFPAPNEISQIPLGGITFRGVGTAVTVKTVETDCHPVCHPSDGFVEGLWDRKGVAGSPFRTSRTAVRGKISDIKELKQIQKVIANYKEEKDSIEENVLDLMEEMEDLDKSIGHFNEDLKVNEKEFEKCKEEMDLSRLAIEKNRCFFLFTVFFIHVQWIRTRCYHLSG